MSDVLSLCNRRGSELVPSYLAPRDHGWLEELLSDLYGRSGWTRREWLQRIRVRLSSRAPRAKLSWACAVLTDLAVARTQGPPSGPAGLVQPSVLRQQVFLAATRERRRGGVDSGRVASCAAHAAATALELPPDPPAILDALFDDIPSEQRLHARRGRVSVEELAAAANSAIVTALLRRSTFISVTVRGNARDIVSHAQQVGLLCSARMVGRSSASDVQQATVRLDIRGPMQLTRHVAAYAARLAALVPLLVATAPAFELEADCSIAGGRSKFRVRGGDGVRLSAAESRVSSPVHDALALDLEYRPGKWRVQRNAEAILADDRVWVPDFELKSAGRRRLVTIHEFWTPEWVGAEFARIRRDAAEAGLVLCLARAGNCGAGELPSDGAILMYTRRIPAARLIRVLDA